VKTCSRRGDGRSHAARVNSILHKMLHSSKVASRIWLAAAHGYGSVEHDPRGYHSTAFWHIRRNIYISCRRRDLIGRPGGTRSLLRSPIVLLSFSSSVPCQGGCVLDSLISRFVPEHQWCLLKRSGKFEASTPNPKLRRPDWKTAQKESAVPADDWLNSEKCKEIQPW
jgi:hypothetical protein